MRLVIMEKINDKYDEQMRALLKTVPGIKFALFMDNNGKILAIALSDIEMFETIDYIAKFLANLLFSLWLSK